MNPTGKTQEHNVLKCSSELYYHIIEQQKTNADLSSEAKFRQTN